MKTFEIFVHDDRYSVPTLHLVSADEFSMAEAAAEALLRANAHHRGVELCHDGEQLLVLGDCAERRRGPFEAGAMKVAAGG